MELDKARYIAIEGPIGVGKTSLVQLLGEYFNAHTVFETVEDNPFLEGFYRNRERYAFQTEMFFLLSRYRQQMSLSQYNLFNRVTITDYIIDRNRILFATWIHLTGPGWKVFSVVSADSNRRL